MILYIKYIVELYVSDKIHLGILYSLGTEPLPYKPIVLSCYNFSIYVLETDGCGPNITDLDLECRVPQWYPFQKVVS